MLNRARPTQCLQHRQQGICCALNSIKGCRRGVVQQLGLRALRPDVGPHLYPALTVRGISRPGPYQLPRRHPVQTFAWGGDVGSRARAGENFIESAVRKELGLQSPKIADDVRQRVEGAIQRQRFRVTAGDVAAQAGVSIAQAEQALKALAYDSLATLEVSSEGEVVYVFSPSFAADIQSKSVQLRVRPALGKVKQVAEYLVRVMFGTALVSSIAITWLAILAVTRGRSNDDDRRSGDSRSSFGGSYNSPSTVNVSVNMFDWWWYWDPGYSTRAHERAASGQPLNFVEAVFSFVFGDGDPNTGYDERRWRALGRFIQSRNGVVTGEEMAPYLDPPPADKSESEDPSVLAALIKFNGEPFVDEAGHLLYRFPSLQRTAAVQREVVWTRTPSGRRAAPGGDEGDEVPEPQLEEPWELTAASGGQVFGVVALGLLNVVGVVTLSSLLADPYNRAMLISEGLGWVGALLPGLTAYATAFFGIPGIRWLINMMRNSAIQQRNDQREEAAEQLLAPRGLLASKLRAARSEGRSGRRAIRSKDVVYSTQQEAGEAASKRELDDWDSRFKSGSKQDSF